MPVVSLNRMIVMKVVNKYIGVQNGYLGDFSYRTHNEFYPEYCNLTIDTYAHEGTTRDRFEKILSSVEPPDQAMILRGVLARFPLDAKNAPETRTAKLQEEILAEILRLENAAQHVDCPTPEDTAEVVIRALSDAEALIRANGAISAVDRLHTAMHGFLKGICQEASLVLPKDAKLPAVFKVLRDHHPDLQASGPRAEDITQILRAAGSILDVLCPLRNMASVAHPNEDLLANEEAMLVINVARSIFIYIDAKTKLKSKEISKIPLT